MPQTLPQLASFQILAQEAAGHAEREVSHLGEIPNAKMLFANSVLVALMMIGFAFAAKRNFERVPKGTQNFAEYIVEQLRTLVVGIVGHGGEKYVPLVGTVFIYILLSNLLGQIPGFHSPTANFSLTLALGLIVFVYVQFEGLKNNGVGHIVHFMGPKLGKYPLLAPLMFPIEVISEGVRPFTLAIRLFGNIFGDEIILAVFAGLLGSMGLTALGWLPLQTPLLFLSLLTAVVQALVFSMLTCIYLSLVQPHHHHEGEPDELEGGHSPASVAADH